MALSSTSAISRLRHATTSGSEFNSSSLLQTRAEDSGSVLQGCAAVAGFEGVIKNSSKRLFYNTQLEVEETGEEEFDDCNIHQPEKKRRLTAEQVHFLERSFEVDNKLEPERKTQLARDLGLQPRQVAVWFQNRRARWKSKQLEKEYDVLKSSYDTLKTNYDNLLKEKEKLRAEVICLTDKLHAKEKGLEILTKDVEEKSDKELMDTKSQLQNSAKSEVVSDDMIAPFDSQLLRYRLEDPLSSGTDGSAVLDEDSPHQIDSGHSSAVGYVRSTRFSPFEANLSDFSHVEEEEESICRKLVHHPREQHILKIEEGILPEASTTACTFAFSMEDQENLWWNWAQVFHPSTEHEHWHASS